MVKIVGKLAELGAARHSTHNTQRAPLFRLQPPVQFRSICSSVARVLESASTWVLTSAWARATVRLNTALCFRCLFARCVQEGKTQRVSGLLVHKDFDLRLM